MTQSGFRKPLFLIGISQPILAVLLLFGVLDIPITGPLFALLISNSTVILLIYTALSQGLIEFSDELTTNHVIFLYILTAISYFSLFTLFF